MQRSVLLVCILCALCLTLTCFCDGLTYIHRHITTDLYIQVPRSIDVYITCVFSCTQCCQVDVTTIDFNIDIRPLPNFYVIVITCDPFGIDSYTKALVDGLSCCPLYMTVLIITYDIVILPLTLVTFVPLGKIS